MKKKFALAVMIIYILGICSCEYDDSNDIDILIPNDSTDTGKALLTNLKQKTPRS